MGAWTPWNMARFAAVEEYDNLRLRNEKNGIGNSHLMEPMDFNTLKLETDDSQEGDLPVAAADDSQDVAEHKYSRQESVVAAQESSRVLLAAEHKSSPQEGDLPVAALRKNIDELLSAFELSFDPSSRRIKRLLRF
ncbi:hypothetical protein CTI12_AA160670 [Artemisia annua]|uniref:Uncharacterized protein n=1 Tax=Artemisia annua TaxID=35608 RepID=A0A2U1PEI6_ARTAN|nr:hypothetical protein CTI12_AA160670 [Artemisia annua]